MKVRNLVMCTILLGASQLQANFITDGYNQLYNGYNRVHNSIVYLFSNQRAINNAVDGAVFRDWSDQVIKQNGATCGFDAYKNGKSVYRFLTGLSTEKGLDLALAQKPNESEFPLSMWQEHLNENEDLDDRQLYALRSQDQGIDEDDFLVIPTITTFDQRLAQNDFSTWSDPLIHIPHIAQALTNIQQAIINRSTKSIVFILGNMDPQIIERENRILTPGSCGHWMSVVVHARNGSVYIYTLDSSNKATEVPDEFKAGLEQIKTAVKHLLKMNPSTIRASAQHLIAQQLPNLLQDAQNCLYNNNNPASAMDIIETIVRHYKNIVGSPAGQVVNDQAGFVLNMLVEVMHQAVTTDNNQVAQKAAECIASKPFDEIITHQIMDDNAKKQLVLKAHTLLVRFPELLETVEFMNLIGTIAQQYPELRQNNGQALFPSPEERVPAPCCFASIQKAQLQAAACPACGSDEFPQLVQAQNPQANAQAQADRPRANIAPETAMAITPCCFQEIPQDVLMAGFEKCPLCDSDQFAQLIQAQGIAQEQGAPSAPELDKLPEPLYPSLEQKQPSIEQRVAKFKQEADQHGMTHLGYAIQTQNHNMLRYILEQDKPSIYSDDQAKDYIVNAPDNDPIAHTLKTYLLPDNLECSICFNDMSSAHDFHFYGCAHAICKTCANNYAECEMCTF